VFVKLAELGKLAATDLGYADQSAQQSLNRTPIGKFIHRCLPGLQNLLRSRLLFQVTIPKNKVSNLAGLVFNFKTKAQCETNEGNAQFVSVQFVSIQT